MEGDPDEDLHHLVADEPPLRVEGDVLVACLGRDKFEVDVAQLQVLSIDNVGQIDDLVEGVLADAWDVASGRDPSVEFIGLSNGLVNRLQIFLDLLELLLVFNDFRDLSLAPEMLTSLTSRTRSTGCTLRGCQSCSPRTPSL